MCLFCPQIVEHVGVRYIAINDGIDTINDNNDIGQI